MVYEYHSFLIHSSAVGHLGCFLAIINHAVMNIGVHMSLSDLVSSVCMPRSGIAGLNGSSISSFLRNLIHYNISSVLCFGFFGRDAFGILASQASIESPSPALEGEVLTTGLPGRSFICFLLLLYLSGFPPLV